MPSQPARLKRRTKLTEIDMKKLITFAIPCYNSADYMEKCIDNLLTVGEEAEIIIIDDGSTKDNTGEIADRYQREYPNICVAHHQENGGHGEGVNQGIRLAKGIYYKVVDSDDWLDVECLKTLMERLRRFDEKEEYPDLIVSNYVYEHEDGPGHSMNYKSVFPLERICTWDDIHHMKPALYFMMHSFIYKLDTLKEGHIDLPKHTFYVDNLYIYSPLPKIKTIYYMDLDLYRYFIGREGQSIEEANMIKRVDQQLLVSMLMIDACDLEAAKKQSKGLYHVLVHHLALNLMNSSIFLYMKNTPESIAKVKAMWLHLKNKNEKEYRAIRYRSCATLTCIPGKFGRFLTIKGYKIANHIIGINDQA